LTPDQEAVLDLMSGERSKFAGTCQKLIDGITEPFHCTADEANSAAWRIALAPGGLKNYEKTVRLAQYAVNSATGNVGFLNTLGALYLRAGRLDDAVDTLNQCVARREKESAYDWVFLAMANRLLSENGSRAASDEAWKYWIKTASWASGRLVLLGGDKMAWDFLPLYQEAKALMEGEGTQAHQVTGDHLAVRNHGTRWTGGLY